MGEKAEPIDVERRRSAREKTAEIDREMAGLEARLKELREDKRALAVTGLVVADLRDTTWVFCGHCDDPRESEHCWRLRWPGEEEDLPASVRDAEFRGQVALGQHVGREVFIVVDDGEVNLRWSDTSETSALSVSLALGIRLDFGPSVEEIRAERRALQQKDDLLAATISRARTAGIKFVT